jgi:hypothetical protein
VSENTDWSSQSKVLKEEKKDAKGADFLRERGQGLILCYLHLCHINQLILFCVKKAIQKKSL